MCMCISLYILTLGNVAHNSKLQITWQFYYEYNYIDRLFKGILIRQIHEQQIIQRSINILENGASIKECLIYI